MYCVAVVFPAVAGTAPDPAGRVLLIYNELGYHSDGFEFSQPAMETFRAALTGNDEYAIPEEIGDVGTNLNYNIPDISPAPSVDILAITDNQGIYDPLIAAFGDEIPDSLSGGNELSHWTQVYDLRFSNNKAAAPEYITLGSEPTSDLSLYASFLADGGGLFIQAEYRIFVERNRGVTSVINMLTAQDVFDHTLIGNQQAHTPIDTYSGYDDFSTNFNDLEAIDHEERLKLVSVGSYPLDQVTDGIPLLASQDIGHMFLWDSHHLVDQNGRLVVSFNINGWADLDPQWQGQVKRGAYASAQNIYALLSGVLDYSIEKSFEPDHGDVGEEGTFFIRVTNNSDHAIADRVITDEVPGCLAVASSSPAWTSQNGNHFTWELPPIAPGETAVIEVDFIVEQFPPCE
jgi:uncharacterized repeat protein (TIGR01451 family)